MWHSGDEFVLSISCLNLCFCTLPKFGLLFSPEMFYSKINIYTKYFTLWHFVDVVSTRSHSNWYVPNVPTWDQYINWHTFPEIYVMLRDTKYHITTFIWWMTGVDCREDTKKIDRWGQDQIFSSPRLMPFCLRSVFTSWWISSPVKIIYHLYMT